ncbi:MAG: Bug family tripartite tricarboxylate transporter substrate binding protein [Beijerinckiaceae bacterium]
MKAAGDLFACVFTSVLLASAAQGASAETVGDFYQGKRITMAVGSEPGGGYDAYARLVTRHIGRLIPGNPGFVVQNMPGGGGLRVTNHLYNVAPKDGTAMATVQRGLLTSPLLEGRKLQLQFDPMKFNWIGSLNSETGLIVVWHTAPHRTMDDLFKTELLVGSSSPSTDFLPLFLNNVIHTKLKIIPGYKSSTDAYLAMERGELQGRVSTGWAGDKDVLEPWLMDQKVRLLAQLAMSRSSEFPDLPLILDYARTPQDKQVMELILAAQHWGRPFVMPPGVPQDRVAAVRTAFVEMTKDQQFLAEAKKLRMDLDIVTGEEIDVLLKRVYATPPEIVELARKAISESPR